MLICPTDVLIVDKTDVHLHGIGFPIDFPPNHESLPTTYTNYEAAARPASRSLDLGRNLRCRSTHVADDGVLCRLSIGRGRCPYGSNPYNRPFFLSTAMLGPLHYTNAWLGAAG